MLELGVGGHVGLPAAPDTAEFRRVCESTAAVEDPQPITRLAALLSE